MKKYVYVDTENVDFHEWYSIVKYLKPSDKLVLPYTAHSKKLGIETMASVGFPMCSVDYVHVKNGTPNALDFVLVAKLAENVLKAPKSFHLIISKDNGYNPAVAYLRKDSNSKKHVIRINSWANYFATHPEEFDGNVWKI